MSKVRNCKMVMLDIDAGEIALQEEGSEYIEIYELKFAYYDQCEGYEEHKEVFDTRVVH